MGDLDGDGKVTAADLADLIAALYTPTRMPAPVTPGLAADVNGDARVTAADVCALISRRTE